MPFDVLRGCGLDVIEYLQEESRVLKERMGGRRLRFTDAERRRLARKAQALDGRPDLSMVIYNPTTPEDAEKIRSLTGV